MSQEGEPLAESVTSACGRRAPCWPVWPDDLELTRLGRAAARCRRAGGAAPWGLDGRAGARIGCSLRPKSPTRPDHAVGVVKRQKGIAAWACGAKPLADVSVDLLEV